MEITTEKHAAAAEAVSKTASSRSKRDGDEAEPETPPKLQKLAEGNKAAAGKGKGKRIGRVSQKYIDMVLQEKAAGTGVYKKRRSVEELVEHLTAGPRKDQFRELVERGQAIVELLRAGNDDILEQYHGLGYAYAELEDDNSYLYDEKICGPIARSSPPPLPPA
jgi:leucyl aminopeptidase (aminopeptidase T)